MIYYHALDSTLRIPILSEYKNFTSELELEESLERDGESITDYIIIFTRTEIE